MSFVVQDFPFKILNAKVAKLTQRSLRKTYRFAESRYNRRVCVAWPVSRRSRWCLPYRCGRSAEDTVAEAVMPDLAVGMAADLPASRPSAVAEVCRRGG